MLASAPDHTSLFFGTEAESLIETWASGTKPKQFDPLQLRVMKNPFDDLCADPLPLIGPIDNHIPNRRPIDKIREDASKTNQPLAVPGTNGEIRMLKHFLCVSQGSILRPWSLTKES